eukprot:2084118-Rhodomonas_salina.1
MQALASMFQDRIVIGFRACEPPLGSLQLGGRTILVYGGLYGIEKQLNSTKTAVLNFNCVRLVVPQYLNTIFCATHESTQYLAMPRPMHRILADAHRSHGRSYKPKIANAA